MNGQITVLMAVHNGAAYLRTAVESILAQTYQPFRLLIVDDASTDETKAIIHSYRDARIELLALERNVGQTAALNAGLRRADTPWIARMDADDFSAPVRLEEQARALDADPALDCVGTFAWLFRDDPAVEEGRIEKPLGNEEIRRQLWRIVPMIHGSLLVRRSVLLDAGGYDERYRYSSDWDLYHRVLPRCRAANIPRRLLGIRRHSGQGSFIRGTFDENVQIFSRLLASPGRTPRDRRLLKRSLAYTYMMRARCGLQERRLGAVLGDVGRACRYSPATTLTQLVKPMMPVPVRAAIRRLA